MRLNPLRAVFAFNAYERDRWVARHARALPRGTRVLDVGAGPCRYRPLFEHCEYETQDFVRVPDDATGWTSGYGHIDYVSDITSIPVPDESFDAVLCTEVLEHVPEPVKALAEIGRLLRPGGVLILTAPQRSGRHQRPYHFYGGFTPDWYDHFLPEYGLEIESIESNGGFFKAYGEESQRLVTILFPAEHGLRRIALFPVYAMLKLRALLTCIACYALDPLDRDREFAVGYHILARKRSSSQMKTT